MEVTLSIKTLGEQKKKEKVSDRDVFQPRYTFRLEIH